MNTIEHSQFEREELKGFWFGEVVQNNFSEKRKAVKVRVRGVYARPIAKEDIPWALPLMDCTLPELGDEVGVVFLKGDLFRPYYFPRTFLDNKKLVALESLYSKIVQGKKASAKQNVVVGTSTFSEPKTESTGKLETLSDVDIVPENVASEQGEEVNVGSPEKGTMVEMLRGLGKEELGVTHTTGTFVDIRKDGSVVIHSKKDIYMVADGKVCGVVEGDVLLKVSGKLEIAAGQVVVKGTVTPGVGPFCAIPNCVFSGAPHGGDTITGV